MEGLRPDGRRWNELRRINCQISTSTTSSACDGSSYIEQGFTKVICNVNGPSEPSSSGGAGGKLQELQAIVTFDVHIAPFSGTDRVRRGRNDKKVQELQSHLSSVFTSVIHVHLLPRTAIHLTLHVLSTDGSLLAACINASTLAIIDAGIPMSDYVTACTAGQPAMTDDPWLDVNYVEENDIPSLTVATVGIEGEKIALLVMESRCRLERLEGLLAGAVSGCQSVRGIVDGVVREHGKKVVRREERRLR